MLKKAAIYARYSCDKQTEQSIEGQIRVINEFAQRNSYTIVTEYIAHAKSAKTASELGQKTRRGMRESALNCQTTGAIPPLGYKWGEDKKLQIDESTAEIPKIAFSMYADGKGKTEIANELNRHGYRTRFGNEFQTQSMDIMPKNKKYIGVYTFKDIEIEGGCPSLIDKETFDRVQEVFLWDDHAVKVLTLNNTQETVTFEEIREFEQLSEETQETQKPLSDYAESGSCGIELVYAI